MYKWLNGILAPKFFLLPEETPGVADLNFPLWKSYFYARYFTGFFTGLARLDKRSLVGSVKTSNFVRAIQGN